MVKLPEKAEPLAGADLAALHQLAFCYTATEAGNNSGIRFMLELSEAQKWCALPGSSGVLHGTKWAYFYTSVANFIECHWGLSEPRLDVTGIVDNGEWDQRIADAGLTKISVERFRDVLAPLGVEIVGTPGRLKASA